MTRRSLTAIALILAAPVACAQTSTDQAEADQADAPSGAPVEVGEKNVPEFEPAFENQTRAPEVETMNVETEVLASGLVNPWAIEALPTGDFLVTERIGNLRVMGAGGELSDPIAGLPEVFAQDQGGLLDVKIGPDFAEDRMIYWTYSKPVGDGLSATAAARGVLSDDMTQVSEVEDIFVQEPPSPTAMHYGSRIVFDGEGHAFITTGEHSSMEERVYAQDLDKTYGKVIRVNLDGSVPQDNPFVGGDGIDTIWSYGHRNVQGAAIEPATGRLWTIEHGPAGGDELNRTEAGLNYGWPVISYGRQYAGPLIGAGSPRQDGMEQPVYYWDPVIAPGDMIFYEGDAFPMWQGNILIAALVDDGIVRLELDGDRVVAEERLATDLGRVRDIETMQDGRLVVVTDYENGEAVILTPETAS